MSSLKYIAGVDLMTVTLTSDYTAADGHMHLTAGHGARLPATGDFWIRTTSGTYQCFKVTARSTDDLTITPAEDGTSDGNLAAGAELKWVLGVAALNQLKTDLVGLIVPPPLAANWGAVNQGTSIVTDVGEGLKFDFQMGASIVRLFTLAVPGATFTLIANVFFVDGSSSGRIGLAVYNSTNGKATTFGSRNDGTNPISVEAWTLNSTWVGTLAATKLLVPWLKITVDATNVTYSVSSNGNQWLDIFAESLVSRLGAVTSIGVGQYSNSATIPSSIIMSSWNVS